MRLVLNVDDCFDSFGFEETARMVNNAGFDAVDCDLFKMVDPDYILNGSQWLESVEEFKRIFLEAGLPVVQTHAPFRFQGYDDLVVFEERIYPTIVRSIEISAALGARCVIVHPLHYADCNGDPETAFARNMKFYKSLIPICKANGIKVAIENMFGRDKLRGNFIIHDSCSRVEEFCRYIDTLDSEYMVACLDIGHTALVSGGAEPWDFIRILGHDRLQTLHVHDNDFRQDNHVTPFSGKIDWYKTCQALGQIDYVGDMVYECIMNRCVHGLAMQMYPTALKYMSQVGRHLIDQVEAAR